MPTLDVFKADGFSALSLTAALEKVPYKPSFLGGLGIFQPVPVRTTKVAIESRLNVLSLVQTTPRGAPPVPRTNENRKLFDFRTVRIADRDRLMSDELQNIRAFGSETELEQVQAEVMRRMIRLRDNIDLTLENHRLSAIQGLLLDADASTIYDYASVFGVTPDAEIDFDLDNASPASGVVRKKCNQVVRAIVRNAKGCWIPGQSYVMGVCGDTFWDDLTAHSEVRQTYLNQAAANELREGNAFGMVNYGGITFVNYQGTDDASTVAVGATKCKFFPVNARDVFQHIMAPHESLEFVNTPGQLVYPMIIPDEKRQMYADIEVYSNPLIICTRPEMLQSAKNT